MSQTPQVTSEDVCHEWLCHDAGDMGSHGAAVPDEPVCKVELSDLHLSEFNASQYPRFGDRLADIRCSSDASAME